MCCNFYVFHFIRESLYITMSVFIIIYCFKARSYINNLKDLNIKTNFNDNNNMTILNIYENSILKEEEKDIYKEFFKKFNLEEGKKLSDNKDINSHFSELDKLNLAIIILLIIFIIPSLVPIILLMIFGIDREGFALEFVGKIAIFILKGRFIFTLILLGAYIGCELTYKNDFENEFFDLYKIINDVAQEKLFYTYYQDLFDLRNTFIINIILFPVSLFYIFAFVFYFYDPCGFLWKRCYY